MAFHFMKRRLKKRKLISPIPRDGRRISSSAHLSRRPSDTIPLPDKSRTALNRREKMDTSEIRTQLPCLRNDGSNDEANFHIPGHPHSFRFAACVLKKNQNNLILK